MAAAGSVLADVLAKWRGSRIALVVGLFLELAALLLIGGDLPLASFIGGFALYGIGLRAVDASGAMQGVLVQRRYGRDIMGGYFAAGTGAPSSARSPSRGAPPWSCPPGPPFSSPRCWPAPPASSGSGCSIDRAPPLRWGRTPRPRSPARASGCSASSSWRRSPSTPASSTWSTVYLHDDLLAAAAIAPLG